MNFGQAGTMTCGNNGRGQGGRGRDEQCSISPPLNFPPTGLGGK